MVLAWKINLVVYRPHEKKITFAEENIISTSERAKPVSGRREAFFFFFWNDDTFSNKNECLQKNRGHILIFLSIEVKPCPSLLFAQLQGITDLYV